MAITCEINGKTYTFRNLEEQVLFLTKELTKIQQSLGSALPDPIAGPEGPTGATGPQGPEGPRGKGVYGCSAVLPSATSYQEGDFYILFNGECYKKVLGSWVLQTSLRGPQGPIGPQGGTEVVANPVQAYTDVLNTVKIDGTVYDISYAIANPTFDPTDLALTNITIQGVTYNVYGDWAKYLHGYIYEDEEEVQVDTTLNVDGYLYVFYDISVHGDVIVDHDIKINSLDKIVDSVNGDPIVICENFEDANGHSRFIEGDINLTPTASNSFSKLYGKWSLSGSHLMFVLILRIENGVSWSGDVISDVTGIPSWIRDKIVALYSVEVAQYTVDFRASDLTKQEAVVYLEKYGNNDGDIKIYLTGISANDTRTCRIEFDLLIDMA